MRVLVCDDWHHQCEEIAKNISEAGQPKPDMLAEKDLADQLEQLFDGIRACFEDPAKFDHMPKTAFDGVDLVILDNNLAHLKTRGARLTAETIAGYVRAFTKATYVVSLNLNPDVDFDLRYLVGDFSTRADLALNINHLANPGLWTGDTKSAKNGFLPWYWPTLLTVADRRVQQIDFVGKRLDQPVVEALGFDEHAISFLSLHARGALSPTATSDGQVDQDGIPFNKLTFRNVFVSKERSLPIKGERQALSDAESKGKSPLRDIIARVVAAEMDLWFRRDVVAPQEPLVDIPHLLMRFPFLLGDRAKDIDAWNASVRAKATPYGVEKSLYDHLHPSKFEHNIWVKSDCFWWPRLKDDERLNKLLIEAKEGDWADVVFCEDRSTFVEREPETDRPVEFPAEFEGAWERRYVARIAGYKYSPRSRLAM